MAFNWQTFKTRTLTAMIFVAVMLAGLLWSKWSFFILFSVVHFGAWLEYQRILEKLNPDYKKIISFHRYGIVLAGWCILLYFTNDELWIGEMRLNEVGFWIGVLMMIALPLVIFFEERYLFVKNMGQSVFGLLYISVPLGLLMSIRLWPAVDTVWGLDRSLFYALFIIVSLWINDTMAYVVGSLIGKTPFSPISPKKTWEGTIGGAILCIVVMTLLGKWAGIRLIDAVIISALAAITGTAGDLFESKLKRMAGVKDSGQIMPGHGGFLDRFDSLLFASVFAWIYLSLFTR
jgi:phosphatidate cytidylyltransferase